MPHSFVLKPDKRAVFLLDEFSQSEIEYLYQAIRSENHVLGFNVPVNNIFLMSGTKSRCDLNGNIEYFSDRPFAFL